MTTNDSNQQQQITPNSEPVGFKRPLHLNCQTVAN